MKKLLVILASWLCMPVSMAASIETCTELHHSNARIVASEVCKTVPAGEAKVTCYSMIYRDTLEAQCVPRPLIDFPWNSL